MNWHKKTLGEIYDIEGGKVQTGPFGSQLHESDYKEVGIPVIMPKDIVNDKLDTSSIARISNEDALRLKQHLVEFKDIIFPRRGEINKRVLIDEKNVGAFCGTGCIRLRGTGEIIDQLFLFYYLKQESIIKWIENQAIGATMMNLNTSILRSIPIFYPNKSTQQKIASILTAYDDLIENNNQRIKLLEEMGEEIYKEWFVRLRFPGYQQTRFLDNEGNEVAYGTEGALPEGWELSTLSQFCNIQMGQSPKSEFYNEIDQGLPFHQGVSNFNNRFPTHQTFCTDLKRVANQGDILLSVRAPVGRINIANCKLIIGRGLCSINHVNGFQNYLYYQLKDIFKHEDSFGNGAVFNAVSKNDLEKIKAIVPSDEVADKFQSLIETIDDEIEILTNKNQLLQQTRDLLLPRLISGKLSVEDLNLEGLENQEVMPMAAEPETEYN